MTTGLPVVLRELKSQAPLNLLSPVSMKKSKDGDGSEGYDEHFLQELMHRCPNILPLSEFFAGSVELVSLGREIAIEVGGGKVRSLDNLFVTTDGRIVMVEAKLWRNPEALRLVVTQALEYGRVVSSMDVLQLQAAVQSAGKAGRVLQEGESIEDYVSRLNDARPLIGYDPARFAAQLDLNLRSGGSLLLIAGDGIHPSVERFVSWFESRVQLPFAFGLVQIGLYQDAEAGHYTAIPRTLLRTREVIRNVVEVRVHAPEGIRTEHSVSQPGPETTAPRAATKLTAGTPTFELMTAERLIESAAEESKPAADTIRALIDGLRGLGFQEDATKTGVSFYDPLEGTEDQPIYLFQFQASRGLRLYAGYALHAVRANRLDEALIVRFRKRLNQLTSFWAPDRIGETSGGKGVPIASIVGKASELLEVARATRDEIREAYAAVD